MLFKPEDDYNLRALRYSIICTYTDCRLTDGDNKLPAQSGLAYQVQNMNNGTYLAGLWKEDLITGLTWYTPNQSVPRAQEPMAGETEPRRPGPGQLVIDRVLFLKIFSRPKENLKH